MDEAKTDAPADGEYLAICRENNPFSAAANGHELVFPQAQVTVKDGWATFYRDGQEVWNCNARYAAANFVLQKV
jgi:archaeosine-15-forming tRNA-guanine transglycosylase